MEYSAGAVIYRRNNENKLEYLIVQSVINDNWGFPKGHLEAGETAKQAAVREVAEEVGLKPKFDFNFMQKTQYSLTLMKQKTVTFFLAEYQAGQSIVAQKEEIKNYKWITFEEASTYLTVHDKLRVLQAAQDYIEAH